MPPLEGGNVSKFTLLDKPIAHPGKCISCGAHDRPVIDFGLLILRVGKIYVCVGCMEDAGSVMGLVKEADDETTLVQEQYNDFVEKVSAQVDRFSLAFSDSVGDFTRSLDLCMFESKRREESSDEAVIEGEDSGEELESGVDGIPEQGDEPEKRTGKSTSRDSEGEKPPFSLDGPTPF